MYSSDGLSPQYDNSKPFEFIIKERITNGNIFYIFKFNFFVSYKYDNTCFILTNDFIDLKKIMV